MIFSVESVPRYAGIFIVYKKPATGENPVLALYLFNAPRFSEQN
jgi:hypothetical protein